MPAAAVPKPPSDPQGTQFSCSDGGEIKLAVLRDGESEQNDTFNVKYTQGLLRLSIQDEGESETQLRRKQLIRNSLSSVFSKLDFAAYDRGP